MMLIGTMAALAMVVAAPANTDLTTIGRATDAVLDTTPDLGSADAEFRNVRIVRLPARHEAVCGEVGAGAAFRRFAYDAVTNVAQAEGGKTFSALWANCEG